RQGRSAVVPDRDVASGAIHLLLDRVPAAVAGPVPGSEVVDAIAGRAGVGRGVEVDLALARGGAGVAPHEARGPAVAVVAAALLADGAAVEAGEFAGLAEVEAGVELHRVLQVQGGGVDEVGAADGRELGVELAAADVGAVSARIRRGALAV